uniref:MIF4G domain-containing protein n=1 Tax=Eutreptiella gymnastica TaxID=73025 RepID=A0A7S1JBS1_9EUGL|mmetsp:Transcript_80871/g.142545  ORF Transcript_80871/g.142545 Transcript_80871/m.142545 type:complete len:844 (+) Transcript_80871:94-2625(+)
MSVTPSQEEHEGTIQRKTYDHDTLVEIGQSMKDDLGEEEIARLREMEIVKTSVATVVDDSAIEEDGKNKNNDEKQQNQENRGSDTTAQSDPSSASSPPLPWHSPASIRGKSPGKEPPFSSPFRSPRAILGTPPKSPPIQPSGPPAVLANRAENAFRIATPEDDRARMVKQIKGLLNKLTPEKYLTLASQIVIFFESTTSDVIVPLIFEKALNELTFAEMYADLFRDLYHKVSKNCAQNHTTFLMALMLRCNLELTKALKSDAEEEKAQEGNANVERKKLKRSVGIAQFIGELYVRDMLKEDFVYKTTSKILHLTEPISEISHIEAEVSCKLLETAGPHWEMASNKFVSEIVPRMQDLSENHPKPRIKILCLNLLDLRKRGWQQRFNKSKPKRLDEDGNLRQSSSPGRADSPLSLRDSLGVLFGGVQPPIAISPLNSPYGGDILGDPLSPDPMRQMKSKNNSPLRLGVQTDVYGRKRTGTPPRVMPFTPTIPLDVPGSPAPGIFGTGINSQPNSPLPLPANIPLPPSAPQSPQPAINPYQHNPYGYTSQPQSPQPITSPQPRSAQAAPQMNWAIDQSTQMNMVYQSPGVQDSQQWQHMDQQMQWQQPEQQMQWQQPDQQWQDPQQWQQQNMGYLSPNPDSSQQMQWPNQLWTPDQQQVVQQPGIMGAGTPIINSPGIMPGLITSPGILSNAPAVHQNHVPLQVHTPVVRQPIPIIDPKDMQPINDPSNPIIVKVGAPKPKAMGLPLQPPTPNTPNSDPKQTRRDSPSARPLPIDAAAMQGVLRNRSGSPVGPPIPVSVSSPALAPLRPPGSTPPPLLSEDQKGNQPRPHTPPPRGLPLSPPPPT